MLRRHTTLWARHGRAVAFCCAALIIALAGHVVTQQEETRVVPLDSLVPAETIGYFSICDLSQAKESFKETALWKIWKDEEVQYAYEQIVKNFQNEIDELEGEFEKNTGKKLDDILEMLTGQVSVALVDFNPDN
ncbi:MAG: hypothetical protein RDV41_15715, partial [Planctomycetota bacterium]|nr:hypothetical protein [Planctomycetota bacterium]